MAVDPTKVEPPARVHEAGDVVVRLPEAAVNKLIDIFSNAFSKASNAAPTLPPASVPPTPPTVPATTSVTPPAPATPPDVEVKPGEPAARLVRRGNRLVERPLKNA